MRELDEIVRQLQDRNLKEVAKRTGLSYGAIYSLARGGRKPSYETVWKVDQYLQGGGNDGGE